MTELSAPRAPRRGETVELQIATRLAPGARLLVLDQKGNLLGAVTPFGPDPGGQTATVPIASSLLDGKLLKLWLLVSSPGVPLRLPRKGEVGGLDLIIAPGSEE